MTHQQAHAEVVVGVDGSDSSRDALRWAARQARLTGATLHVVTTWEYPLSYGWAGVPEGFDPEGDARAMLQDAVREVVGDDPAVSVRLSVLEGHPAAVLVAAAEKADVLVVGSRGHGAFAALLLGSVGEHCAHHAACPLVIIRPSDHQ